MSPDRAQVAALSPSDLGVTSHAGRPPGVQARPGIATVRPLQTGLPKSAYSALKFHNLGMMRKRG